MINCTVCGSRDWELKIRTNTIVVNRCNGCGIDLCDHLMRSGESFEYDKNWENASPDYLNSLASLRQTQAKKIAARLIEHFGKNQKWCDFGTGRGWFPKTLKQYGVTSIGVDASAASLEFLKNENIETKVVSDFNLIGETLPDITGLSLLDVLEHFKIKDVPDFLKVLNSLPKLQALIVKVPVSSGFFYWLSLLFAKIGIVGPYETLFQVGTNPPHEVYFSENSLVQMVSNHGFALIAKQRDLDFEPRYLLARVFKTNIPIPFLSDVIGGILSLFIRLVNAEDSVIFYFEKIKS